MARMRAGWSMTYASVPGSWAYRALRQEQIRTGVHAADESLTISGRRLDSHAARRGRSEGTTARSTGRPGSLRGRAAGWLAGPGDLRSPDDH